MMIDAETNLSGLSINRCCNDNEFSSSVVKEEIEALRIRIKKEPWRAKAMSKLACILMEESKKNPEKITKCKQKSGRDVVSKNSQNERVQMMQMEANKLAKKSIEVAPKKPFGYSALSVTSPDFSERMIALEKAIQIETEMNNIQNSNRGMKVVDWQVGMTVALIRFLVEPREEEKRIRKSTIRNCRDLTTKEREIYDKIKTLLLNINKNESFQIQHTSTGETMKTLQYMAKANYRLGIFFRRLKPEHTNIPNSRWHFHQVTKLLPSHHELYKKSIFWLATISPTHYGDEINCDTEIIHEINIDRCPEEYIVSLYSSFAANFDNLLVEKLHYQTPTKLRALLDTVIQQSEFDSLPSQSRNINQGQEKQKQSTQSTIWSKRCADLGCGTGLSGIAFQNITHQLVGVDLSPEMIEKAKQRNCYSKVVVGDVESIFSSYDHPNDIKPMLDDSQMFDLVVACDVFVYIGDLRSIFDTVRECFQRAKTEVIPGSKGIFAFSTEFLEDDDAPENKDFILQTCARFSHKCSYVQKISREFGFQIRAIQKTVIRKNDGEDVYGNLVVLSFP
mmetsp:Transcript_16800/g.23785  ORF Transcript_16800/g.23785 Transcript_16800/m.23785 type:complete len:563 (+) Transcript_16800:75-1763(+)